MRKLLSCAALVLALVPIFPAGLARAQQDKTISDGDIEVLSFVDMLYPPVGRQARLESTVTVRVKLDDQGRVTDASAISGHPVFASSSLENVRKWLFKPNASKTAVVVYNFRIIPGRCHSDSSLFVLQGRNMATVLACPPQVNE